MREEISLEVACATTGSTGTAAGACDFLDVNDPTDDPAHSGVACFTPRSNIRPTARTLTAQADPQRIFAVGFSNGGSMAHTMACTTANTFSAVGPVSFALAGPGGPVNTAQVAAACRPSQPVTMIQLHGTADGLDIYGFTRNDAGMTVAEIEPLPGAWRGRPSDHGADRVLGPDDAGSRSRPPLWHTIR